VNPATKVVLRYVFPSEVEVASDVTIVRSDSHLPAWLRDANPGGWHPVEWDELLDGQLGPWAMVVDCERVISIAHTPVPMTGEVAECGVWTEPGSRSRGHATASASIWAEVLRPSGRRLVYRTTEDNLSSRRVAERLWLRLVSRIEEPRNDHASNLHPLSSVRQVSE